MKYIIKLFFLVLLAISISSCSDNDSTGPDDDNTEILNLEIDGEKLIPSGDVYYDIPESSIEVIEFLDDKEFAKNTLMIRFPLLGESPEVKGYEVVVRYEEVRGESTTPDISIWNNDQTNVVITQIDDGMIHGEINTTIQLISGDNEDSEKNISGHFILELEDTLEQ